MDNVLKTILVIFMILFLGVAIFFGCTYSGRAIINNYQYGMQKVDDRTTYDTRKEVEDTCRAYIANYSSDKLMYDQYKDSKDEEQRGWAASAKTRANKTATMYNQFILKNSFVFEDNIPADISWELKIVE